MHVFSDPTEVALAFALERSKRVRSFIAVVGSTETRLLSCGAAEPGPVFMQRAGRALAELLRGCCRLTLMI